MTDTAERSMSHSITVAADAERLYRMVTDIARMGEWSPECTQGVWEEGGGPRAGSWFVGKNATPERTWERRCQVVIADPPKAFGWVVGRSDEGNLVQWVYRFEPVDGGTEVTEEWALLRWSERMAGASDAELAQFQERFRKGIEETLSNLKRVAEAEAPA
jgi:uncharacterized protein YndB with AHSA1/START domain